MGTLRFRSTCGSKLKWSCAMFVVYAENVSAVASGVLEILRGE